MASTALPKIRVTFKVRVQKTTKPRAEGRGSGSLKGLRGVRGQPWAGTSGDNDICQPHGGLDVLVKGRLDKLVVLLDDPLDVPAALADVPAQAAHQADVRVCVHEYLQIQELERTGRGQIPPGQVWDSTHLLLLPQVGLSPAQHPFNRAWLCSAPACAELSPGMWLVLL